MFSDRFSEYISAAQVENYISIGLGGRGVSVFHDNSGEGGETTEERRLLEDEESRCQVVKVFLYREKNDKFWR